MQRYKAQPSDLFHVDRVKDVDGFVWYKAKPVCLLLGFKNPAEALKRHAKEDAMKYHVGNGAASFYISRKDVMRLAMKSKSPQAEEFHEWLIEVAESVFDTGAYISPDITPIQAIAAIDKLSSIADMASPWEKMWSKPVLDVVRRYYSNQCDKTFWWKYIYNFLTPEERCELDEKNPVLANKQREYKIHQWIETEQGIKTRLTAKVNEVQVLLRTSTSKQDFETRYQRILGATQTELDLDQTIV